MSANLIGTTTAKVREDFSAANQSPLWVTRKEGAGMTVDWTVPSALRISAGTTASSETVLRYADPFEAPARAMFLAQDLVFLSQRIVNQEFELRLVSDDGTEYVSWVFDGTVATTAKMRSANGGAPAVDTTLPTPNTATGAAAFELELWIDECYWHARASDSVNARTTSSVRNRRIPDPHVPLFVELVVRNLATAPASNTILSLDAVLIQDITELSVEVTGGRGGGAASQAVPVLVSSGALTVSSLTPGSTATALGKAEDAVHTTGDVGVEVLGVRAPAAPTAATSAAGDYSYLLVDAEGKVINSNQAESGLTVQAVVDATLATDVALVAAAGAGVRTYLTDLTLENTGATANRVIVSDGATRVFSATVPPGTTFGKTFSTPLRGTAATALNVRLGAAGTVTVSASGYRAI